MKFVKNINPFLIDTNYSPSKNELSKIIGDSVNGTYHAPENIPVTLADVSAIDNILRIILNRDFENIQYADNKPFMKNLCIEAICNYTEPEERKQINIDTYRMYNARFNQIIDSLRYSEENVIIKKYGVSLILSDDSITSLSIIKVIIESDYEEDTDTKQREVHYILPLLNPSPLPTTSFELLLLNGNGEARFDNIPLLNDSTIKTDAIIKGLMADEAIGYAVMDRIDAMRTTVLPYEDYARIYTNTFKATLNAYTGIGFALSPKEDKLLTSFNNKLMTSDFDYANLYSMKNDVLLYDNRPYLDKIEGPINISLLADSEISFNGFYMDEEMEEPNDKFLYQEATTATATGRAINKVTKLPKTIIEELKAIMSKFRNYWNQHKKAKDDALREKLINDEFIPLLDSSLKWLISGATTFGLIFCAGVTPLYGIIGGAIVLVIKSIHDEENKKRVTRYIVDELDILDEKINDSRNSDDRQQKYALMRIKKNLLHKLDKVKIEGKLA